MTETEIASKGAVSVAESRLSRQSTKPKPETAPPAEELFDYVDFIRNAERRVGPDGYIDSKRFINAAHLRQKKPGHGEGERGQGLSPRRSLPGKITSLVDLHQKMGERNKEFERRMRALEDHIVIHKQKERELKRHEGDILKTKKQLHSVFNQAKKEIDKEESESHRNLQHEVAQISVEERELLQSRLKQGSKIAERQNSLTQSLKEKERQAQLRQSEIMKQYAAKRSKLDGTQTEIQRMLSDFEQRLKKKESEQFRLKQELAELATKLNLEAMAVKKESIVTQSAQQQLQREGAGQNLHNDTKHEAVQRSRLHTVHDFESKDKRLQTRMSLAEREAAERDRDTDRKMVDTRRHLVTNANAQRTLDHERKLLLTEKQDFDRRMRLEVFDVRRRTHSQELQAATDEAQSSPREGQERIDPYLTEAKTKEKVIERYKQDIHHQEQSIRSLSKDMKEVEYQKIEHDQAIREAQEKLQQLRHESRKKVLSQLVDDMETERQLLEVIRKEKSYSEKYSLEKEEKLHELQKLKTFMIDNREFLDRQEKDVERLLRMKNRVAAGTA